MATGGLNLTRKLEQRLPEILTQRYRELPFEGGLIVPTLSDLEAGAAELVREQISAVGDAALLGSEAIDIPIIDLSATENRYKIVAYASAFSYSFMQERSLTFAGEFNRIFDEKMMVADRVIAERVNKYAAYGNTQLGVKGFVNDANVTAVNSSFDPYTSTPDEIAEWLIDELESLHTASNNVHYAGELAVSTSLDFLLMRKRMPDSNMSVKAYILANLPGVDGMPIIKSIKGCKELGWSMLEANGVETGGTNKDRIVYYPMDPIVVERHNEPSQLMPEEWQEIRDGRKVIPMFQCSTQTIINHPTALRYIRHAKKA